jgi:2-keto-4-pentenoate hydratase/2-oxohepta-3-ene-1,7-dioic acid hydratase in catechol pathway
MTITAPLDSRLRLFSYADESGRPRLGFLRADGAVDVAHAAREAEIALGFDPTSMPALIEAGPAGMAQVRELAASGARAHLKLSDLRLLPPIPKLTRNIFCVGWNYLEHFAEGAKMRDPAQKLPEHPVFFTKATGALNGPFDPIPYDPAISVEIDWEVEFGVVIGKRGRDITQADALEHIFGYTIVNDVSARDLQKTAHGGQWFKGKSLDGHAPMGPWIVPAADLDPANLRLILRVNGAVKQDGSTKDMYFKIPRIIAELSRGLTLEPGDVIATGTPSGVGMGRTPPEWLKPGDAMESEIQGIGAMRNAIVLNERSRLPRLG